MVVTEKEALGKICPMGRLNGLDLRCQGSACMGWREDVSERRLFWDVNTSAKSVDESLKPLGAMSEGFEFYPGTIEVPARWIREEKRGGYCGMVQSHE